MRERRARIVDVEGEENDDVSGKQVGGRMRTAPQAEKIADFELHMPVTLRSGFKMQKSRYPAHMEPLSPEAQYIADELSRTKEELKAQIHQLALQDEQAFHGTVHPMTPSHRQQPGMEDPSVFAPSLLRVSDMNSHAPPDSNAPHVFHSHAPPAPMSAQAFHHPEAPASDVFHRSAAQQYRAAPDHARSFHSHAPPPQPPSSDYNLMSWVQQTTRKIDDIDRRLSSLGNSQKVTEEMHNLKRQDVGVIVNAIDEMRYTDLKASVQNDRDRIEQLAASYKLMTRDFEHSKTKIQAIEEQVTKAMNLESEAVMSHELRSQQDALHHKKHQKQLAALEQSMHARFEQLETVVRENNSRCLLMEEEVQFMKETMSKTKAMHATEQSNARQIRLVNEELAHLRERVNTLLGAGLERKVDGSKHNYSSEIGRSSSCRSAYSTGEGSRNGLRKSGGLIQPEYELRRLLDSLSST